MLFLHTLSAFDFILFNKSEESIAMVRKCNEKTIENKPAPFNGNGQITVRSLLNGMPEMYDKGRIFAHTTVYPDSEIGYHVHEKESETYYILSGTAELNDNGTTVLLQKGDVAFTGAGEGHGIRCVGTTPVEMIALILFQ